jgi:acyl carrier protein phosphodiesterase
MNGIKLDSKVTRLKTKNSKRKVFFAIQNKNHAKLLDEFLKASKNISTKTLFKEVELWNQNNENLNVTKSIMPYNKIVYLNKIIQNITKRYCTMHSLRASFATYRFEQRLFSKVKYTEEMLNFAVEMGHETSLITFQTYIHSNLIGEL